MKTLSYLFAFTFIVNLCFSLSEKTYFHSIYLTNQLERTFHHLHISAENSVCVQRHLLRRSTLMLNSCRTQIDTYENKSSVIFSYKYNLTIYMIPCKTIKKIPLLSNDIVSWLFMVQRHFNIHFVFLKFELDDSGEKCHFSSVQLFSLSYLRKWKHDKEHIYCGRMKPFDVIIESSTAKIIFREKYLINRANITIHFEIVDQNFNHYSKNSIYQQASGFINLYFSKSTNIQWLITTVLGKYLILRRCECLAGISGEIFIYDGPDIYHLLTYINLNVSSKYIFLNDITTKYYKLLTKLKFSNFDKKFDTNILLRCLYSMQYVQSRSLYINSSTQVYSNNLLMHKVFRLHTHSESFMKLSFNVREFDGYNEGGCSLGGFTLTQFRNHTNFKESRLGPFCFGATPYEPLLSKTGLRELTLSRYTTHILIYAYGPLYNIDIDINLEPSLCEGVLDPMMSCRLKTKYIYLDQSSYTQHCRGSKADIGMFDYIMYNIKTCVVIQATKFVNSKRYAISLSKLLSIRLEYFFSINYLFTSSTQIGEEITVHLQDSNMKNYYYQPKNMNGVIFQAYTKIFMLFHQRNGIYCPPVYKLAVHKVNRDDEKCGVMDTNSFHIKDQSTIVSITNLCGVAHFQKSLSYLFMFKSGTALLYDSTPYVLYVSIEKISTCNETDILALGIPGLAIHAIPYTQKRDTFTFESSNRIIYYRLNDCSQIHIRYNMVLVLPLVELNSSNLKVS